MGGLAAAVEGLPAGWRGHFADVVDSTQDQARAAARSGAPSRSLFVADYQRRGRGRQGRMWVAGPGQALLLSMIFRQPAGASPPWHWTSLASVSLCHAIDDLLPDARPAIKWPNDVVLHPGGKVAGILAETASDGRQLVAIVGVGVNVSTPAAALEEIEGSATSLLTSCGREVDRGELLLAFVRRLDQLLGQPHVAVFKAWKARLWGRGQRLPLLDLGHAEEVVILAVEPDGSLRVRMPDGTERRTTTGEILV